MLGFDGVSDVLILVCGDVRTTGVADAEDLGDMDVTRLLGRAKILSNEPPDVFGERHAELRSTFARLAVFVRRERNLSS